MDRNSPKIQRAAARGDRFPADDIIIIYPMKDHGLPGHRSNRGLGALESSVEGKVFGDEV